MVHSKLSIIFILIASAIAPVVAPPPPATSHDVHGASSSHSPPPSSLSHPGRQVRPLPKRSQAVLDKGKAREVLLGSPNNPSIPGSSNNPIPISSSSSSSSQHSGDVHSDLEFEQGSSNLKTPGPSKKRKFDSQQVPSDSPPKNKPRILTAEQKKRKSDYEKQKRRQEKEEREKPEEKK